MRSAPWWSGLARAALAAVGICGLFIAIDSLFLFVLLLVSAVLGGDLNPYAGLFLFIVVPVLVLIGASASWCAYRLWQIVPNSRPAEHPLDLVVRS
jgi:hypothetical protein